MQSDILDQDIIAALNDPNTKKSGIEMLVRKYYTPVQIIAFKHTGNRVLSMDITQNVFESVMKLKNFSKIESLQAYIIACTINESNKQLKIERKQENIKSTPPGHNGTALCSSVENIEYKLDAHSLLLQLPARRREALVRIYLQDQLYQKVAEIMGISVNTLENYVRRAKDSLKNITRDNIT